MFRPCPTDRRSGTAPTRSGGRGRRCSGHCLRPVLLRDVADEDRATVRREDVCGGLRCRCATGDKSVSSHFTVSAAALNSRRWDVPRDIAGRGAGDGGGRLGGVRNPLVEGYGGGLPALVVGGGAALLGSSMPCTTGSRSAEAARSRAILEPGRLDEDLALQPQRPLGEQRRGRGGVPVVNALAEQGALLGATPARGALDGRERRWSKPRPGSPGRARWL